MADTAPKERLLRSWIAGFHEYTEGIPSPEIFRRWAAIAAVAGALERRVWVYSSGGQMFPNMFLLLVAPPGVGKDQAINPVADLWGAAGLFSVAPISLTHKGLLDQLSEQSSAKSFFDNSQTPPQWYNFHSLLIAAPELGVLLPSYDLGYISALNELFNCRDLFEERMRSTGKVLRIERPHLHMITGTQPKYLGEFLPEPAYGMGFTARIIMIYAGDAIRVSPFAKRTLDEKLRKNLIYDLQSIGRLHGQFTITEETKSAIESWYLNESEKDKPTHSKLIHYNTRRIMHILKLCMTFSAARSNELVIEKEDFLSAHATLLEVENLMPQIFKEISSGSQISEIEEAFHFLVRAYSANKGKPVAETRLIHFLASRVPTNQIPYIVATMVSSGMIKEAPALNLPGAVKMYIPVGLTKVE